jgi:hypothetical protein
MALVGCGNTAMMEACEQLWRVGMMPRTLVPASKRPGLQLYHLLPNVTLETDNFHEDSFFSPAKWHYMSSSWVVLEAQWNDQSNPHARSWLLTAYEVLLGTFTRTPLLFFKRSGDPKS